MENPQINLTPQPEVHELPSQPKVLSPEEIIEIFIKPILKEGESLTVVDSNKVVDSSEINDSRVKARRANISPSPLAGMLRGDIDKLRGEDGERLKAPFRDKIVVDIGAGDDVYGYIVAQKLGASCYVAVEPFYSSALLERFQGRKELITIPFIIINEDGLSVMKKLKDGSVSVITSATDDLMLRDRNYNRQLNVELSRVISGDGGFLGYDSVLFPKDFEYEEVGNSSPPMTFGFKVSK